MSEEMESEGKTVAEAVENALKKMGLHRDQVEVQILQEASPGILGFGAKTAKVKISPKHWGDQAKPSEKPAPRAARAHARSERAPAREKRPRQTAAVVETKAPEPPRARTPRPAPSKPAAAPAPVAKAVTEPAAPVDPAKACAATEEVLNELLKLMLFENAGVAARWDTEQERVKTNVRTTEAERLIGMDGKVLESMQFLMTLMVSRKVGTPVAVQVDTGDYWQKKENEILSMALKGIEVVRNTGKPYRLQPMEAPMRRLIHKSLANHPDIATSSEGDGPWRKIVLRPKH
jgi:spoIIIJ-associated protein